MTKTLDPIVQTERRLALLRELRELLTNDPSLASVVRDALAAWAAKPENNGKANMSRQSNKSNGTLYTRTVQAFRDHNNQWMTSREILERTGTKSRGSVGVMLYKTNAADFEVRDHPNSGKLKQWRFHNLKEVMIREKIA